MPIHRLNFDGDPNIGILAVATENAAIIPKTLDKDVTAPLHKTINVPIIATNLCGSSIIGAFLAGNSNGLITSRFAYTTELELIRKKLNVNINRLPDKFTAVGSILLGNDNGAVVHPNLSKEAREIIAGTLNVDVYPRAIAGIKTVGAAAVATNKGCLVHPDADEDELRWLEDVLDVYVGVGTVNHGMPFVGAGMIANSHGVVVGLDTTGPEIARIEETLGLIK